MSNKLQNKPDPKNNDLFKEGIYYAYVEVGFSTEWKLFELKKASKTLDPISTKEAQ